MQQKRVLIFSFNLVAIYAALVLIHSYLVGSLFFLFAVLTLFGMSSIKKKYLMTLLAAIVIMAINPVSPSLKLSNTLIMAFLMVSSVIGPYLISQYVLRQHLVHFNFDWSHRWSKLQFIYCFTVLFLGYFVWPNFFALTGAYTRWPNISISFWSLLGVFVAFLATGIWEEIYFIGVIYNILRRYLSFEMANLLQAFAFTIFLYQLGFRSWAPVFTFIYAFSQGFMYEKTKSMLYVVTIHVFADVLIFLSVLHAYYPQLLPIFVTIS